MPTPSRPFAKWIPIICALALGCGASSAAPDGESSTGGAGDGATVTTGTSLGAGGSTGTAGGAGLGDGGASGIRGAGGSSAAAGAGGVIAAGGASGAGGSTGAGGAPVVGPCNALPAAGQWQQVTPPGVSLPRAMVVDPFDTATVWVGAAPAGNGQPAGKGGLYKSTDCGSTWAHVNTGAHGAEIDTGRLWSLAVDPVEKGVIYVVGAYGPQGLLKSTNGGVDWVQLFPATSEFAKSVQYNFVGSVSMGPENHLHLVVGTHGDCLGQYAPTCMAESTDGGASWTIFTTPFLKGWGEQTGPYVLDATTLVFATLTDGLWLTTDHGAHWTNVTPAGVSGATGGEYTHRPFAPTKDGSYFLPSYNQGGLLRSTDVGRSWSRVANAPHGSYELGIALGGGNLYLADYNGKTYAVTKAADPTTWSVLQPPPPPADAEGPKALEYDDTHHLLYSSNTSGGLWRIVTP